MRRGAHRGHEQAALRQRLRAPEPTRAAQGRGQPLAGAAAVDHRPPAQRERRHEGAKQLAPDQCGGSCASRARNRVQVHVKVSPDGRFEGVEPILGWEDSHSQYVPPHVLWRLQSPDLAVVRPAVQDIPLRQLLGNLSRTDASYYVEYLSLASNLPALAGDVTGYFDLDRDLALDHENVWIGNGRTVRAQAARGLAQRRSLCAHPSDRQAAL